MPIGVRLALILLWVAWVASAGALGLHVYRSGTKALDLYSALGVPALLAQALLIVLITKRYNFARLIAVAVAIPGFIVVHMLLPDMYSAAALRINVETALRLPALALLLTPGASRWFSNEVSK